MSTIIAFFATLFAMNSSLGIPTSEVISCQSSVFTTLMYHHVREYADLDNNARNISVSPKEFEEQMKYLHKNNYKVITSQDIENKIVPCKSVMITFDDGYYDVYNHAYPIMQQYGFRGVLGLIPAKIDESDYLFWSDIRKLLASNWEIASHTWHHTNLSTLPKENMDYEIGQSKKDLEKWFHTTVDIFIYPNGRYTDDTLREIKSSGYRYSFTTKNGMSNLLDNPLELNRIDIAPGTTIERFSELLKNEKIIIPEK